MPKHTKKGKQENDEDFDDMLAEFQIADLATSTAARPLAASSLSSTMGADARPSVTLLPSLASGNAAGRKVSEEAIVYACLAGNLAQLQRWGQQGVRARTADPLCLAVQKEASFNILKCLVNELGSNVD
jgi:hypothetical protein